MGRTSLAVVVAIAALATAPGALAGTNSSTNWSGYAVHGSGLTFRSVRASWVQPTPSCRPGSATYSSYWVGLGGYSSDAAALEQIGTEADCRRSGRPVSSAWFETVPNPSFGIFHPVHPGDLMAASVTVKGNAVTLILQDQTHPWTFAKTLRTSPIDVTSAEWIVESPSDCFAASCRTLPLADFGSTTFSSASATSVGGHTGPLSDSHWQLDKILLRPAGREYGINGSSLAGGATPSALLSAGSFAVNYSLVSLQLHGLERSGWVRAGRVVHPALVH